MDNDIETVFDLESLRNWNRSQLKLLKIFVRNDLVTQKMLAGATGMTPKSNALGGKITALSRSGLILKAGKDESGEWLWQLNDNKVKKDDLQLFLEKLGV